MKKILFTLEIALFLSALPVTLGLAMARENKTDSKSVNTIVVEKKSHPNTASVTNYPANTKEI